MAWSTPLTATSNAALTSAQWNASVRDNLLETAPAKFSAAGQMFISTGANAGAVRTPSSDFYSSGTGADSTNSTSYIAMGGGPVVTVNTGANAIVFHSAQLTNDTAGSRTLSAIEVVAGATAIAPSDLNAVAYDQHTASTGRGIRAGITSMYNTLNSGSNIFAQRGRVSGNTGTLINRGLVVIPL